MKRGHQTGHQRHAGQAQYADANKGHLGLNSEAQTRSVDHSQGRTQPFQSLDACSGEHASSRGPLDEDAAKRPFEFLQHLGRRRLADAQREGCARQGAGRGNALQ